jgi:hypothetical protein
MVAGRVLMRDRHVLTLSRADVLRDARAMAERVRLAVGGTGTTMTDGGR